MIRHNTALITDLTNKKIEVEDISYIFVQYKNHFYHDIVDEDDRSFQLERSVYNDVENNVNPNNNVMNLNKIHSILDTIDNNLDNKSFENYLREDNRLMIDTDIQFQQSY